MSRITTPEQGPTLGEVGLAVNIPLEPQVARSLKTALKDRCGSMLYVRKYLNVNLVDYPDVRSQAPIASMSAEEAKTTIETDIPGIDAPQILWLPDKRQDTVKFIPSRSGETTVIVNLHDEITERNEATRTRVTDALEEMTPPGVRRDFEWRDKNYGLIIGTLAAGTTTKMKEGVEVLLFEHLRHAPKLRGADILIGATDAERRASNLRRR